MEKKDEGVHPYNQWQASNFDESLAPVAGGSKS